MSRLASHDEFVGPFAGAGAEHVRGSRAALRPTTYSGLRALPTFDPPSASAGSGGRAAARAGTAAVRGSDYAAAELPGREGKADEHRRGNTGESCFSDEPVRRKRPSRGRI